MWLFKDFKTSNSWWQINTARSQIITNFQYVRNGLRIGYTTSGPMIILELEFIFQIGCLVELLWFSYFRNFLSAARSNSRSNLRCPSLVALGIDNCGLSSAQVLIFAYRRVVSIARMILFLPESWPKLKLEQSIGGEIRDTHVRKWSRKKDNGLKKINVLMSEVSLRERRPVSTGAVFTSYVNMK